MKAEEYDKLTDEEKRIKVAELCGWKFQEVGDELMLLDPIGGVCAIPRAITKYGKELLAMDYCPDYLNDLNACHEFEASLGRGMDERYLTHLGHLVLGKAWEETLKHGWLTLVYATAPQRCKAFVLAMKEASQ